MLQPIELFPGIEKFCLAERKTWANLGKWPSVRWWLLLNLIYFAEQLFMTIWIYLFQNHGSRTGTSNKTPKNRTRTGTGINSLEPKLIGTRTWSYHWYQIWTVPGPWPVSVPVMIPVLRASMYFTYWKLQLLLLLISATAALATECYLRLLLLLLLTWASPAPAAPPWSSHCLPPLFQYQEQTEG